jgi:DNA-binding IscR family transcriptional regulator
MSVKIYTEVWAESRQKGTALLVQLALAEAADDEGKCTMAVRDIARKARTSDRQVRRILSDLKRAKAIKVYPGRGPAGENEYKLEGRKR